jgi:hypothetical protein
VKRHLKLLYFLTLGTLCLCLTAGPAGATTVVSGPQITNATIFGVQGGGGTWTTAPAWNSSSGTVLKLDGALSCPAGGGECFAGVQFGFAVTGATPIAITLGGTSTDPSAHGRVFFNDPQNSTEVWVVRNGSISMTPFILQIPGSGGYHGELDIDLDPGTVLDLGHESLDFTIEPEPSSALLLCGGLALVEFLRRKIRR